jgi:hypothetical protein
MQVVLEGDRHDHQHSPYRNHINNNIQINFPTKLRSGISGEI